MKRITIWAVAVLASGCTSLSMIRDEAEAVGTFRLSEISGTIYDIELRPDHSCVMSTYSSVSRAPLVDATWTFNGGVVTISPAHSRSFSLEIARRGLEVVLISEDGRGRYVRISEKTPNKAPEPTTLLVTPRAGARVAPSRVVAHL